jgi:hypothetical protein
MSEDRGHAAAVAASVRPPNGAGRRSRWPTPETRAGRR